MCHLTKNCWLIIALITEKARLVYDVEMWTSPYAPMQVMLAIDGDREVTLYPARVLFVELAPRARVLWNSGVSATGLLLWNDGGPGRTDCLLASQRSNMMMMDGHQLCQSTGNVYNAWKRYQWDAYEKVTKLFAFIVP